jgi:hypothetical protein
MEETMTTIRVRLGAGRSKLPLPGDVRRAPGGGVFWLRAGETVELPLNAFVRGRLRAGDLERAEVQAAPKAQPEPRRRSREERDA